MAKKKCLEVLKNNLVVSCQALADEPLHSSYVMQKMAQAAILGGAQGIRANSIEDIKAIRQVINNPIIGIIKQDYEGSEVRITPTLKEVKQLIKIDCEIIALDATLRSRPDESLKEIIEYVQKYSNQLLMADCATIEDVEYAIELGFDIIGSTLVGYSTESSRIRIDENDFEYLKLMINLSKQANCFFIAEGNINTPEKAKRVLEIGADSVVVGSAITRPQLITKKFTDKIKEI